MKLKLKVIPGAASSSIAGRLGDELKVRVSAPPKKGKANQAVIDLLATALRISPSDIKVITGENSQHKIVEINVTPEQSASIQQAMKNSPFVSA